MSSLAKQDLTHGHRPGVEVLHGFVQPKGGLDSAPYLPQFV